jgi:hypothetical protein
VQAQSQDAVLQQAALVEPAVEGVFVSAASEAAPAAAQTPAQPAAPTTYSLRNRLTFSVLWGPDNQFSGKVITAGSGLYQGVTPINFSETSYDDIYGRMGLFKVGVGYQLSARSEANLNFVLSRSDSQAVDVGTIGAEAAPVTADFDDYAYWGIEGGQRFFFSQYRFTPFAGYTVGINRFTHIDGDFSAPAVNAQPALLVTDGQFFDSAWAFSVAPIGGVLVGFGAVEIMGEVALRFMGGLSDVDPLSQADLKDINAESSRWSFPFLFGARFRF